MPRIPDTTRIAGALTTIVLAAVMLGTAWVYALNWSAGLSDPAAIDYEGHVLWSIATLAQGGNIYNPAALTHSPWSITIYPPLYMIAALPLVKCFGLSFPCMRLLSMVSAIICGVMLFLLLRTGKCDRAAALTGVLLFFSFVPVCMYTYRCRVDMLAMALSAVALYLWCRQDENLPDPATSGTVAPAQSLSSEAPVSEQADETGVAGAASMRTLGVSTAIIVAIVMACLAKQQSVVIPLSICVSLAVLGKWQAALRLFAVTIAAVAFANVVIQLATGGFLQNLTFMSRVPWQAATLMPAIGSLGVDTLQLVSGAAVIVFAAGGERPDRSKRPEADKVSAPRSRSRLWHLSCCLLLIALLFMLYTMGVRGALTNHLIFVLFAFSWVVGQSLNRLPAPAKMFVLLSLSFSLAVLNELGKFQTGLVAGHKSSLAQWKLRSDLQKTLVLSEDPYLAMVLDSTPAMVDVTTFMNGWKETSPEIEAFTQSIAEHKYAAIVINLDDSRAGGGLFRWPRQVVQAVWENYLRSGVVAGNGVLQDVYLPKQ